MSIAAQIRSLLENANIPGADSLAVLRTVGEDSVYRLVVPGNRAWAVWERLRELYGETRLFPVIIGKPGELELYPFDFAGDEDEDSEPSTPGPTPVVQASDREVVRATIATGEALDCDAWLNERSQMVEELMQEEGAIEFDLDDDVEELFAEDETAEFDAGEVVELQQADVAQVEQLARMAGMDEEQIEAAKKMIVEHLEKMGASEAMTDVHDMIPAVKGSAEDEETPSHTAEIIDIGAARDLRADGGRFESDEADDEPGPPLSALRDPLSGELHGEIAVALVPADKPWHVPAWLSWGDWNECPEPEVHVAMMRRWSEEYGAQLVAMTNDTLECVLDAPPTEEETAKELAGEMYNYCFDIVEQGMGSIDELAAALVSNHYWFFWWD